MRELFCKPRARCFKGLGILTGIYALGCGLMLVIIPPVMESHGVISGSKVETNLNEMKLSTLILLAIFVGLSVLNLLVFKCYEKKEGRRESIINGQLMQGDFTQQIDDEQFEQ